MTERRCIVRAAGEGERRWFFGGGLHTWKATAEDANTIEEVYEPYLIQLGFIDRTPRGRVAMDRAFDYFKIPRRLRSNQPTLWQ
jgi:Holliday junction DNA helicase RuvB